MERKLFQKSENLLHTLGIFYSKPSENFKILLWKVGIFCLPLIVFISSISLPLLRQISFSELAESVFIGMSGVLNTYTFIAFASQNFAQLFENSREIVGRRNYSRTNFAFKKSLIFIFRTTLTLHLDSRFLLCIFRYTKPIDTNHLYEND